MTKNDLERSIEPNKAVKTGRQFFLKLSPWLGHLLRDAGLLVSIGGLLLAIFTFYLDHRSQVRSEMRGTLALLKNARDSAIRIEVSQLAYRTPLTERPNPEQKKQYEFYEELRYVVPSQLTEFEPCLDQVARDLKDFAAAALPPRRVLDNGAKIWIPPFTALTQDLGTLEAQVRQQAKQRASILAWLLGKSFPMEISRCFVLLPG